MSFACSEKSPDKSVAVKLSDPLALLAKQMGGSKRNALLKWCQKKTENYAVRPIELSICRPVCASCLLHFFIHSLKDLRSTSSRKLLRGAPDSCRVKNNHFQLIIECVRKCPK